jgi:hypothetical protein
MPGLIHRRDDIVEYQDLEKIALYQRIPNQVHPKPIPEDRQPPGIRELSLQPDKDPYTYQ